MTPFEVQVDRCRSTVVLSVFGELDVATAPDLEAQLVLAETGDARLVIDLTGTTFLDSTGLKIVVRAARRVDAPLTVVCPPSNRAVMRVLAFAGLDEAIRRVDVVDEA